MSAPPTPTDPADIDAAALCRELAAMSMAVARALHDRIVLTDHAPPPAGDHHLPALAAAFSAVSAAIRRSLLLAAHLAELPRPGRAEARRRITSEVEQEIARAGLQPERAERLAAELHERLDRLERDEILDRRPVADIVRTIVRDLGLRPDRPGRDPVDTLEAALGALRAEIDLGGAATAALRRAAIPAGGEPANAGAPTHAAPERAYRVLATPNNS